MFEPDSYFILYKEGYHSQPLLSNADGIAAAVATTILPKWSMNTQRIDEWPPPVRVSALDPLTAGGERVEFSPG
jgi:hypothetical protein